MNDSNRNDELLLDLILNLRWLLLDLKIIHSIIDLNKVNLNN